MQRFIFTASVVYLSALHLVRQIYDNGSYTVGVDLDLGRHFCGFVSIEFRFQSNFQSSIIDPSDCMPSNSFLFSQIPPKSAGHHRHRNDRDPEDHPAWLQSARRYGPRVQLAAGYREAGGDQTETDVHRVLLVRSDLPDVPVGTKIGCRRLSNRLELGAD